MRIERGFALIAAALLVGGCETTTTRTHPTLEEQLHHVDTVVVIPPRVEIEYVTLTGENERMTEEEDVIRSQLITIAERELRAHGYNVAPFDFENALEQDDDFAYLVTQIREGFDKAKEDLGLGKPVSVEQAKKLAISVGDAATIVAAQTGADAILLMRYSGFDKSDGHVAKDVGTSVLVGILTMGQYIPISMASGAFTEVALIDGTTGELLWADVKGGALNAGVADHALDTMPHDLDPG
jgi:hypothetical protein